MYSDAFFNFYKLTEDLGLEEGTEILRSMSSYKPSFLLDTGLETDDLYERCDRLEECMSSLREEEALSIINSIHLTCGIMPTYDTVMNRYDLLLNLEETIKDFKDSDNIFSKKLCAIGPCGIDHDWESEDYHGRSHEYFDHDMIEDEKSLLALQLTLGKKLNMPIMLHSREGFRDTMDVLKAIKWNRGVVHGFSYTKSELDFFLDLGWYISFSGSVTYSGKKHFNDMEELVTYVPKDRLIIESDSPYYPPVHLRSSHNVPSNIKYIYEYIASKRGISTRKLSDIVDDNLKKLFS